MMNKTVRTSMQVRSTGGPSKKGASQSEEDFPLEVTNLLNVCARIESRRQSNRRNGQKGVN